MYDWFYINWGDTSTLTRRIFENSDEIDFTLCDLGIYDLHDIPCPFGIQEPIRGLTKISTASIERLIDELIFLPFEYHQN